jgi:glycogen operon protein
MILAGDEFGRTQRGNNNAYCQDNEVSWMDWDLARENEDLLRFFRLLIRFRQDHLAFRFASFDEPGMPSPSPVTFHGLKPYQPDWSYESRCLDAQFTEDAGPFPGILDFYLAANAFWEPLHFELPALSHGRQFYRVIDTSLPSPEDICEPGTEPLLPDQNTYQVQARTVAVLMGK